MAISPVCASCLRAIRKDIRRIDILQSHHTLRQIPLRSLSTSSRLQDSPKTASQPPPPPSRTSPPKSSSSAPPIIDTASIGKALRSSPALRSTTEPYIAYGSTEDLFHACQAQCSYTIPSVHLTPPVPAPQNAAGEDVGQGEGWWFAPKTQGGLGLEVTFSNWAQITMLHMYILTVKLRCFPAAHVRIWRQNLIDHFFYAAEDRMALWHGLASRAIRNKYLKDLNLQWKGLLLSYDEGLIKGDAVLGTAVWRNVFRAKEETDVADVALVTAYLRRQLARLDKMDDAEVSTGKLTFEEPSVVKALLSRESPWMRREVTKEDVKMPEQK